MGHQTAKPMQTQLKWEKESGESRENKQFPASSQVWVVYTPPAKPIPTDDQSLKELLVEIEQNSEDLRKSGIVMGETTIESLRALREIQNEHRSRPIQHASFTRQDLAERLASYLENEERPVEVIQMPENSVNTPTNEYEAHLTNGLRPFTILMQDGGIFEYWGYASPWEWNVHKIEKVTHMIDKKGEYMSGTFWGKSGSEALDKAGQHWTMLVGEGNLTIPLDEQLSFETE